LNKHEKRKGYRGKRESLDVNSLKGGTEEVAKSRKTRSRVFLRKGQRWTDEKSCKKEYVSTI